MGEVQSKSILIYETSEKNIEGLIKNRGLKYVIQTLLF